MIMFSNEEPTLGLLSFLGLQGSDQIPPPISRATIPCALAVDVAQATAARSKARGGGATSLFLQAARGRPSRCEVLAPTRSGAT